MVTLIDANVILRYITGLPPEQAEQARAVIAAGAFTTMEVIAEVIYVLQKVYRLERAQISDFVMEIAEDVIIADYDVLAFAMDYYRARNLDFVDCVLAARAFIREEDVFTFDKKLAAFIRKLNRPYSE
ncbi:MAG: PIN domain-containing protein [Oscillibacter sp.]|nr:PIN domain-containing protein [Oscillibacter sp.]